MKPIRFDNLKRPPSNAPHSEVEIEGVRIDLHSKMRMVGFTFGIEPLSATVGWAALEPLTVLRAGQALPVCGLALHFSELTRFEASFQEDPPGALEYFELRHDPEPTIIFFFEGGTLRLSAAECRAELVIESDEPEDQDESRFVQ